MADQRAVSRGLPRLALPRRHALYLVHATPGRAPAIAKRRDPSQLERLGKAADQARDDAHHIPQQGVVGRMMNVGLHHRGVDPQPGAILQAERHRRPNQEVIDGLERRRRQPIEAAVERIMLGYRIAVEIGELTQRQAVGDPFPQLAIVPVLDPHQDQRAQHLSRRQAAPATCGLLQAAHEIAPHPLDHLVLFVEETGNRLQQRLHAHALPYQFDIRKTDLPRRRSRHGSALLVLRCARPRALQRLDIARAGLHQQVLQGTPVIDATAHLAHEVFGNVDRKPPSVVPTVQNVTAMLFAGQTSRAVRLHTPAASKAQRAEHRRPQAGRLAFHPANDIGRRFGLCANHP
jgi:hypothetical protein